MGKRLFRFNGTFKVDVLDEEIEAESKEDAQRQLECWAEGRIEPDGEIECEDLGPVDDEDEPQAAS